MDQEMNTPKRGLLLQMDLGERVIDRKGRWGTLTQVNSRQVVVRFDALGRAILVERGDVIPQRWIDAQAEVDQDEAAAAAFRGSVR